MGEDNNLNEKEKKDLIAQVHEETGHSGVEPTYILLKTKISWPSCYVDGCKRIYKEV